MDLFRASLKHFHMERLAEELTLKTWSLTPNAEQRMDERAAGNSVPSEPGGSAGAVGMERSCPEISHPSLRLLHESIVFLKEFLPLDILCAQQKPPWD